MHSGTLHWHKKILIVAAVILISLIGGLLIARNYQQGLALLFLACIITGISAFLAKNLIQTEALFYLFLFSAPLMNIFPSALKYILPLGSMFLIFLILLFYEKTLKIDNLIHTRNGRLLVAYVILNLIIFPYSVNKISSLTYLVSFPLIILLWDWIIQVFNSEDRVLKVIKTFNVIGLFYSVFGLILLALQYLGVTLSDYVFYIQINRIFYYISSVFPNTNTHGMLLSFTLPCAFYLALEHGRNRFYWLSFFLMGINLFLTFSRSSWGASFIALAIILLFKYKDKYKINYKKLLPVGLAGLALMAGLFLYLVSNFHFGKFSEGIFSLNARGFLWQTAVKAISDQPITGYGVGNSVAALELYSPDIGGRTPHNTFLRMWVEMGLFGMLIYVGFLWNIMRGFIKARNKSLLLVTVFAVLAGSFFQQIFESMLLAGLSIIGAYFLTFSALLEALIRPSPHEQTIIAGHGKETLSER